MSFLGKRRKRITQHPWFLNIPPHQQPPKDAEEYWEKWIGSKLPNDQKILVAENLFGCVWKEQGTNAALDQVLDKKQYLQVAQDRFDQGCHLWRQQQFESALVQLQKSLQIQEAHEWCHEEMEVQLHYAIGTVHLALQDTKAAMTKFHQAWRVSGLQLGTQHVLTKSSQHMIGSVLSQQKFGIMEIHHHLNVFRQAIVREKEGEYLHSLGEMERALAEYHECLCGYDTGSLEQAAVRCKMAIVHQELGERDQAGRDWSAALAVYQSIHGSYHPRTIRTMECLVANQRFEKVDDPISRRQPLDLEQDNPVGVVTFETPTRM